MFSLLCKKYLKIHNNDLNQNLKKLIEISDLLMNLKEEELNMGFWNIVDKYKLDNAIIKIKNKNNGFKTSFPINHLFTLLNNNLNFCINYKLLKNCRFCNEKKENIIYLPSLIPISLNEINNRSGLSKELL